MEDLEKKVANVIETDKQMSEVSSLTLYHFIFRSLYILIPQKLRSFETSKFYLWVSYLKNLINNIRQ